MNFAALTLELEKRCLDLGQSKRPEARYEEALNNTLPQYPRDLWPLNINGVTLDTVADTREYALAGIATITTANQVRRVWIDDSDGVKHEIGRYEVQDSAGTLTLILDEAPTGAYDITIEYWAPPTVLAGAGGTTEADDDWLLAKAMLSLMGEADWKIEDPQLVMSQVEYWNARATNRERQLMAQRRRTSRKPRTNAWRQYV